MLTAFHITISDTRLKAEIQKGRITPLASAKTRSTLFASLENGNKKPRKSGRKFILALQKAFLKSFAKLVLTPRKLVTRFKLLSRRGKALVAVQTLTLLLLFGSAGRSLYSKHHERTTGIAAGPPIEVSYSNFLDLAEQSGSRRGTSPNMENVQISPDRIVYRLTKEATPDDNAVKQLACYTNKVAASPELIDTLRKNDIPFTAANRQRANNLALAVRTAILGFYMLILWRMYKSFSGNSGSGDVPGKLASKSSLPLASFDDIQGVDEAKTEVMELVDTLRNPTKYAILGARAPTGLLLEGPPGK